MTVQTLLVLQAPLATQPGAVRPGAVGGDRAAARDGLPDPDGPQLPRYSFYFLVQGPGQAGARAAFGARGTPYPDGCVRLRLHGVEDCGTKGKTQGQAKEG